MKSFYSPMKETKKPGMLIIHKSWCGACKQLMPKFAASTKIEKLSEDFVMINTLDDDEPQGSEFQPDGGYIPRILFFDPESQKVEKKFNSGRNDYKYFYSSADDIVSAMTRVSESYRPLFTKDENDLRTEEQKKAAEESKDEL